MKHERTGHIKFYEGFKLYQLADNFWEDDIGNIYDINLGKLYVQREPGKWYWLRTQEAQNEHKQAVKSKRSRETAVEQTRLPNL